MSNELIVKAAALISAGDIEGAEYALVSLVESEGDHALVAVLDDLPPKDLLGPAPHQVSVSWVAFEARTSLCSRSTEVTH